MNVKDIVNIKGFNKSIKWIAKDKNGICFGYEMKPSLDLEKHPTEWTNNCGYVYDLNCFTNIEFENDEWTKCIEQVND